MFYFIINIRYSIMILFLSVIEICFSSDLDILINVAIIYILVV